MNVRVRMQDDVECEMCNWSLTREQKELDWIASGEAVLCRKHFVGLKVFVDARDAIANGERNVIPSGGGGPISWSGEGRSPLMCGAAFVFGLLLIVGIPAAMLMGACIGQLVGERAPSPSPVATATARADSEAAPARSLADGNGEDGGQYPSGDYGTFSASPRVQPDVPPASTVTQSALKEEGGAGTDTYRVPMPSRPTVTVSPTGGGAYIAPATPVATSRAVETLAPKSINSYDPWPAHLWPTVECLIQRESGGNSGAVGSAGERGLMQVGVANFTYLAERGIPPDSLFDPATNILAGWMIYLYWQNATGDGFWPWKSTRGGCA